MFGRYEEDRLHSLLNETRYDTLSSYLLYKASPPDYHFKYSPSPFAKSHAFMDILEVLGTYITFFWAFTALVPVASAILVPLTAGVAAIAVISALLSGVRCYNRQKTQDQEQQEFYHVMAIRHAIADELLRRKGIIYITDNNPLVMAFPSRFKTLVQHGIGTSLLIVATFFWGIKDIATVLELTIASSMTGPLGLFIAAAVALAIGMYAAHIYYQTRQHKNLNEAQKAKAVCELQEKIGACKFQVAVQVQTNIQDPPLKIAGSHFRFYKPDAANQSMHSFNTAKKPNENTCSVM